VPLREPVKEGAEPPPYPFIGKTDPFIPSAGVRVAAQSETPVCVMASNLGDAQISAQTAVTDAQGNSVIGGKLKISQRIKAANGTDRLIGVFQAGGLPAGKYSVKLLLKVGDSTVESSPIDVEVTAAAAAAAGAP